MKSVGLKHVKRDTVDELCLRITKSWPRTRRETPSETGAKRPQDAEAPDSQEQKKIKKGEAVGDSGTASSGEAMSEVSDALKIHTVTA